MTEISATIRLRPTRIGFLVQPTDLTSVRKIMRACACLWGGIYNPIIPVFRNPPREWRSERFERVKGLAVAKGYIDFFEPDVFVESKHGLLEDAGLGALREEHSIRKSVISLSKFLAPEDDRDWSEPAFGLNIIDVYRHLYETEQRFQPRDKRPSVQVKPQRGNGLVEAIFGAFPNQRDTDYISEWYVNVFAPTERKATPDTWLEVFKQGAQSPLLVTRHGIDRQRYWYHDPLIYVFDPAKPIDLIDCWNLRLEPHPVLPIPFDWLEDLADQIREFLISEYRPVRGSTHGIMHYATVELSRSIPKHQADDLIKVLNKELPKGALIVKHHRNRVWAQHTDDQIHRDGRLEVTAEEQETSLTIKKEQELTASFKALAPKFASQFGGHHNRWVNTVTISAFSPENIATVIPFNMFDRRWPRLALGGNQVIVGSEGWVYSQIYKNWNETLEFLTKEDAIIGTLKRFGVEAKLSEPGQIAKQMLEHLEGLRSVNLLGDLETLQLLNKMAGGLRRRINDTGEIEETFGRRSVLAKIWSDLIAKRTQMGSLQDWELTNFTKKNIIRLGVETDCPHCQFTNWHSLAATDYSLTCERCLNRYDFPQSNLRGHNQNWAYRVVGPFSVPDYGRGSYSSILTLRVLEELNRSHGGMTYSTAMNLKFEGIDTETDFVALWRKETHGTIVSPGLVIGETKSFGAKDTVKSEDLKKLTDIGRKLPGTIIVISVLRDHFTPSEKEILQPFVKWGRRKNAQGRPTNPVILLTAHELFMRYLISATWKELGKPYELFTDYEHTRNLYNFANATQQIHLGLPSIHEARAAEWKKRAARKKHGARKKKV